VPRSRDGNGTELDAQPFAIAVHPSLPFAYVSNNVPGTITVIQLAVFVPEFGRGMLLLGLVLAGALLQRSARRRLAER
jgi:hypothetical protein